MDDERREELETLAAIYPELLIDASDAFSATLELPVSPASPLLVRFAPADCAEDNDAAADTSQVVHELRLSHLPPFTLRITLPPDYPEDSPPVVNLSTQLSWLPDGKLRELEQDVAGLWEECGRCQILFGYVDHLQQAAERGFDLEGRLTLSTTQQPDLLAFDTKTVQDLFNAETYDCGICLDPKKGVNCTYGCRSSYYVVEDFC